jgi:hypothetical protein
MQKLPYGIEGPYRRGDKEDHFDDLSSKFGVRMAAVRGVLAVVLIIAIVGLVSTAAAFKG